MAQLTITIDGASFPCRQTMGAMLRFKQETGKEVTSITSDSITDLLTFLWCCTVSACKHDGIKFDVALLDFADSITAEDLSAWAATIFGTSEDTATDGGEKKSR